MMKKIFSHTFQMNKWTILAALVAVSIGYHVFRHVKRRNDPMDYAALDVPYHPQLSTTRFDGLRKYDPVTYDSGIAAMKEFSRQYQSSFLAEVDPTHIVKKMTSSRKKMQREFHALQKWLPNDVHLERNVLAGIEETDARMAHALADVAARFPHVKLLYTAGQTVSVMRAADEDDLR
jgi:hypothetical protein